MQLQARDPRAMASAFALEAGRRTLRGLPVREQKNTVLTVAERRRQASKEVWEFELGIMAFPRFVNGPRTRVELPMHF